MAASQQLTKGNQSHDKASQFLNPSVDICGRAIKHLQTHSDTFWVILVQQFYSDKLFDTMENLVNHAPEDVSIVVTHDQEVGCLILYGWLYTYFMRCH